MAFLDNSGDIILDAVLTDTGRMRLAKGDGSFRIKYFALSDDEIDYTTYNRNHSSGSAYYDLDIMQTPVLEAFTDNRASLKHKLMTINNRQILYLPVLRLNEEEAPNQRMAGGSLATVGGPSGNNIFGVAVNEATRTQTTANAAAPASTGVLDGVRPKNSTTHIMIDQGLVDTVENVGQLPHSLIDSAYLIEIDDRLGSIVGPQQDGDGNTTSPEPSFVDDDKIATYFISNKTAGNFVGVVPEADEGGKSPITGRKGTRLKFKIRSHPDLADSNVLFNKIGKTAKMGAGDTSCKVIDTVIRVTGAVTGQRIDLPIRFFKLA
tara:strand:- start:2480 stop:3442 length:963 start_codon:yes stop_codon:yes gene_type:complete